MAQVDVIPARVVIPASNVASLCGAQKMFVIMNDGRVDMDYVAELLRDKYKFYGAGVRFMFTRNGAMECAIMAGLKFSVSLP